MTIKLITPEPPKRTRLRVYYSAGGVPMEVKLYSATQDWPTATQAASYVELDFDPTANQDAPTQALLTILEFLRSHTGIDSANKPDTIASAVSIIKEGILSLVHKIELLKAPIETLLGATFSRPSCSWKKCPEKDAAALAERWARKLFAEVATVFDIPTPHRHLDFPEEKESQ